MADVITKIEKLGGNGVSYEERALLHADGSYSFDAGSLTTPDGATQISRQSVTVDVTPPVTAALAYAAGDVVGGLLTFPNAVRLALTGELGSARLKFKDVQTGEFDLYLFNSAPATVFTDKTLPAIGGADWALLAGVVAFASPYSGLGTHTLYTVDNIQRLLVLPTANLYGVLITKGTPTFTTTSAVEVSLQIHQD